LTVPRAGKPWPELCSRQPCCSADLGPCARPLSCSSQVSVRILGGLMALGYEIGTIMKRTSIVYADSKLTIKLDTIDGMGGQFVQVCHFQCHWTIGTLHDQRQ